MTIRYRAADRDSKMWFSGINSPVRRREMDSGPWRSPGKGLSPRRMRQARYSPYGPMGFRDKSCRHAHAGPVSDRIAGLPNDPHH
jgi:hypothetical protein